MHTYDIRLNSSTYSYVVVKTERCFDAERREVEGVMAEVVKRTVEQAPAWWAPNCDALDLWGFKLGAHPLVRAVEEAWLDLKVMLWLEGYDGARCLLELERNLLELLEAADKCARMVASRPVRSAA